MHVDKVTCVAREGMAESSLPPKLTTLCELLVFIKNMELASNTYLQAKHLSSVLGSRQVAQYLKTNIQILLLVFTDTMC